MGVRKLTLELVKCATVWAARFPAVVKRNSHFGMRVPQIHIRHRAGQRQILGGDFDMALGDILLAHNAILP